MDTAQVMERLAGIEALLGELEEGQKELRGLVARALHGQALEPGKLAEPPDGPMPPDKFRLKNRTYEGFTSLEWKLLSTLWGKSGVEFGTVIGALYGHDADNKDDALMSVKKRLNHRLDKKVCPAEVTSRNGFLVLQLY